MSDHPDLVVACPECGNARAFRSKQKIIEALKPSKFWRYNSITKQWKNVLGE